ncbi:MAG: cytochrome b/b6 domain-containing protein [Caldisericaceae bacterium]|nr:cytochrome b/b6 domain-containing protein [Caldisericaceae bacterium]
MKKLYLYPLGLRIWHWTNVTLYIVLILTGISMHYPSPDNPLIPFKTARLIHMYLDF